MARQSHVQIKAVEHAPLMVARTFPSLRQTDLVAHSCKAYKHKGACARALGHPDYYGVPMEPFLKTQ